MIRPSKLAGSTCVALASVAVVYGAIAGPGSDPGPGPGSDAGKAMSVALASAPTVGLTVAIVSPLGFECALVSATLASQLNVQPESALVVRLVIPGSPADVAGVQEHDVITEVEGEPADEESLSSAASSGGEVELELKRAGTTRVVVLPGPKKASAHFVATDSLSSTHPIVRLRDLNRQRAMLDGQSEDIARKRRDISEAQRATRDEAREAVAELHEACVAEARTFLEARRDALRSQVDEAFAAAHIEPLAALRMDLELTLPAAHVEGLDSGLHDMAHALEDDLAERVGGSKLIRRRASRVAKEISSRMHERLQSPWSEVQRVYEHHADSLGARHDRRMDGAREALDKTRRELHERIDCAVERSVETFSKQMRGRLSSMDVPRSAEIEASLSDLSDQLDAWTMGFVHELNRALATYEGQVQPARTALAAELPVRLAAAEEGQVTLMRTIEAISAERFLAPFDVDPASSKWRSEDAARAFIARLRASLGDAVDGGRNAIRPSARAIEQMLRAEEQRSDEAWSDLRSVLQRLRSRAGENCWSLDGPFLDGRFAPRRGDVVMAD